MFTAGPERKSTNARRDNAPIISTPVLCLVFCSTQAAEPTKNNAVRLAVVNTPRFSGLLDSLLPGFEKETGIEVEVYSGNDVFKQARAGNAGIVISHYGKKGVERFVTEGYGA